MENSVPLAIEGLRQQLGHVADTISEIKDDLKKVVLLDKNVSELTIRSETARKDIELLWQRHDTLKAAMAQQDEFRNTFNGGMRVFLAVFGICQTFILGSVVWVYTNVSSSMMENRLQDQRISQMEIQLKERK